MATHERVSNANSRLMRGRALGLIAAALALLGAHSASATGPTLFTAIEKQSGGILDTTNLITTSPTYYGYYGGGGAGTAQVTSAGGFAVPANAFSTAFTYTFTILPLYPYIKIEKTVMNEAGTFGNSYFAPSVPITVPVPTGTYPTVSATPIAGFLRVVPGSKGFGGRVNWDITKLYTFDYVTSLGILHLEIMPGHDPAGNFAHGGSPLGVRGATDNPCCRSYPKGFPPTTYPQYVYSAAVNTVRGPWFTGMLTVQAPLGAVVTTTTQTGVDARSAPFTTGVISMVTPRNQYVWQKDGAGTLLNVRSNFGVIHALEVTFAPEPGQLAMLASGIVGLLGLQFFRHRRR